jgi:RecJ-like exonuclease
MIILRCRICKGTGEIPNEQYKICQSLKSHKTKKYFHIMMEDSPGDNELMEQDACNNVPETVSCPACDGVGTIAFSEEDWDLQIVTEGGEE